MGYDGKSWLAISNQLLLYPMRGRKSREKPPFLHILKVGNDTGQLLKHAFKSLPGVQVHEASPHQQIICADIKRRQAARNEKTLETVEFPGFLSIL